MTRLIAASALLLDCTALALLMLVPLARPLGLADLAIPTSAVFGWLLIATPLALASAALIAEVTGAARRWSSSTIQSGFIACFLASVWMAAMWLTGDTAAVEAGERVRGFTLAAAAIFAVNLLALWRPFLVSIAR